MLCPVCNENPLGGRQATCSAKCRSALYRQRKQKKRDTSQNGSGAVTRRRSIADRPIPRQKAGDADSQKLEQIVSDAVEQVVKAIQALGHLAAPMGDQPRRVDLRVQISSAAPQGSVGYRIVLPGRRAGDLPTLSPKRSQDRAEPWFSLTPFEYPDDIRLCDGSWYRLVWVDVQGRRIRLQPGEPAPALYYFIGPPHTGPGAGTEQLPAEPSQTAPPLQQESSSPLARSEAKASLLGTFPSRLLEQMAANDREALATLPPLSLDDSNLLIRFVQQPEWMMHLLHEEKVAAARAAGASAPPEPHSNLAYEERKLIRDLLTDRAPAHFVPLCKLIYDYARKHGPEALHFLPTPPAPLPAAEQQRLEDAIASEQKRMYLDYVHSRQESQLRGLPLPEEPMVSIGRKERNQLRRMMHDTRAVVHFERNVHPPLMLFSGDPDARISPQLDALLRGL